VPIVPAWTSIVKSLGDSVAMPLQTTIARSILEQSKHHRLFFLRIPSSNKEDRRILDRQKQNVFLLKTPSN